MKFKVIIREDKESPGWYNVSVPSLPGCHSQGRSIEEAIKNIKEAIELYLETDEEELVLKEGERIVEVEVTA